MPLLPSVLPVIDLMDGVVVRGIAGQRATYQSIRSQIARDATPVSVAHAFVSAFGFQDAYIADLDAIASKEPAWQIYQAIADCGLKLIIDAGIGNRERAKQFCEFAERHAWMTGVVAGLESALSIEELAATVKILGPELGVFSLDLKQERPITAIPSWQDASPASIAAEVIEMGVRRMIVLDLAAVGTGQGTTTQSLCRELHERFANLEIISGGGVRSRSDVDALVSAGCKRVLVASSLHDQRFMAGH